MSDKSVNFLMFWAQIVQCLTKKKFIKLIKTKLELIKTKPAEFNYQKVHPATKIKTLDTKRTKKQSLHQT